VKIKSAIAKDTKFLDGLKFTAPAIIVFSADRSKHQIVKGRASAMKAVGAMRAIGQPAYESNIKKTLQKAKVLLSRYDQISDSPRRRQGRHRARSAGQASSSCAAFSS